MHRICHPSVDTLAAWTLGALDGEALRQVDEHLAMGCVQCARDQAWVERVITRARADQSVAPPPHVLARAVRIFSVGQRSAPRRDAPWWRLRALPLFDSLGMPAAAGARGIIEGPARQTLYHVPELNLEIDMYAQQSPDVAGYIVLRGQVFADDDLSRVAALSIALATVDGEPREVTTFGAS